MDINAFNSFMFLYSPQGPWSEFSKFQKLFSYTKPIMDVINDELSKKGYPYTWISVINECSGYIKRWFRKEYFCSPTQWRVECVKKGKGLNLKNPYYSRKQGIKSFFCDLYGKTAFFVQILTELHIRNIDN